MGGGGRTRKVEKGVLGGSSSGGVSGGCGSLDVPRGPVFYPTEEEFKDPLEYIYKIRPEAEPYGICKIVPPKSWKPPFALDTDSFTFPTKSQAIHQLQARSAPCDPKTFRLEYGRFLEEHCRKKVKKRIDFEGDDLDLCKLFNAVKRFGGYDNVAKMKKWGEVYRFVRSGRKISQCSKHVLSLLYLEHLLDYEEYYYELNKEKGKNCKRLRCDPVVEVSVKRRRKNKDGDVVKVCKAKEDELDQICEQCKSGLHGDVMLLCDRCNKGWHMYCLSPPLKRIPPGNWYCLECLNSEKDCFGFVPGKQFSLEAFRRVADRVKKKWFGSSPISSGQLEKKFWEIVEGSAGDVEVMYGSDLDTSVYGSGFPRQMEKCPPSFDPDVWNEYCTSPWNLNNLPRLQGSILRTVHPNIAGVMVPWLYIGMLFSSFCWHFEDHCFYSMNYLHWGEAKCWYSVPGNEIHSFEKVMRSSLPDLFEAQPDLLFQLVTMLNPSVLQEKGVPVYSIIQEPGNFVITFPRSYHGGFNFGLNCAEAVNFAPADWLPHGGFGAELYRHYHRVPVLSHEELLCVVAKSDSENRVCIYLKNELLRIYNNEKTWRERLWRNGIIRSSAMAPRVKPEYVGTEEDPMCVICQQLLYLSAVSCNCRPLAFVCLEHWEHLCECKPNKLHLLYRHSLAELSDLLHTVSQCVERIGDSQRDACTGKVVTLTKKVKGGQITHVQLAEGWILKSCKILERPYSRHAYASAIEEAEQFLWAGSEMDLVREITNNLIQAQNWAEAVIDCNCKVKLWFSNHSCDRVQMDYINELLRSPAPCNEPSLISLKDYQAEANALIEEINASLTLCSEVSIRDVSDLESLHKRAIDSPIHLNESVRLELKLSAVKAWLETVRKCLSQKANSLVEVDMLYKLESEMLELKLQLPEADLLAGLVAEVKCCQSQCNEMLKDTMCLKEVKLLLSEWENLCVNIPELECLKKFYSDTISWISRVDLVLTNVQEREDQDNVVDELTTIHRDGLLLRIQVDELPRVEVELQKARCRVEALKAFRCQKSIEFIEQLISEATMLQIEKEKLFTDMFHIHSVAVDWEKKAKHVLASGAQMSDFEAMLRDSDHIGIVPPSLLDVKNAVSTAKGWLAKAKPFILQDSSCPPALDSFLQLDLLKELVLESENLKVHLEECSLLVKLLRNAGEWEQDASLLLQNAENLWKMDITKGVLSCFIPKFEQEILSMDSALKAGISLGLKFNLIPKLEDACSKLRWCVKALSYPSTVPAHKEVEMMLEAAAEFPVMYRDCALGRALIECLNWLEKSLDILDSNHRRRFEVSIVEELIIQSEEIYVLFPVVIGCLDDAVRSHKLWVEQVHIFFAHSLENCDWNSLLQLKERGSCEAFSCEELEKVHYEVGKVLKWKQRCADIIKPPLIEESTLLSALIKLKDGVEKSIEVYRNCSNGESRNQCFCCSSSIEDNDLLTCICEDSFHLQCTETSLEAPRDILCSFCKFSSSSKLPHDRSTSRSAGRKYLELDKLAVLLSDASGLCLWTDERRLVHEIVERAHVCRTSFAELVKFALTYVSKDLDVVTHKMRVALKAINISGICDDEEYHKFELALARHLWKVRAEKLLGNPEKPTLLNIQHHLEDGLAISIPPEDYFRLKLTEIRDIGVQWANLAKEVSVDGGMLGLERVFELISEGENLPVSCAEELKLLRDRSMLYCICRKPYDRRAMIACDKCDEWYHFDCINITSAPKMYFCPACSCHPTENVSTSVSTTQDRLAGGKFEEPQTPLRRAELRRNSHKPKFSKKPVPRGMSQESLKNFLHGSTLLWRNRKPFRRAAQKRSELQSLSPLLYVHKQ